MKTKITFIAACVIVLSAPLVVVVQARPDYGIPSRHNNRCTDCHTTTVTERMEVAGEDALTDLGLLGNGSPRGPLKTFRVVSGQVVSLSVRVLDGNDRFAVQLKDFEKSGRRNSESNLLIWSPANEAENVWTRQELNSPAYFTKDNGDNGGLLGSVSPITYTFDLLVESGTPFDFYELVFAVPGLRNGVRVYQEEHFYLEVTSPFDLNDDGIVDGADMGLLVEHWQTDDPRFDIAPSPSGDGIVDVQDLIALSEHLFEDSRILAHWMLNETEGDMAYDSVATHDAEVMGNAFWQPEGGQVGGALQFDGIDDYVIAPFALNPADAVFSVFAWVKGGSPGQVIMAQTDGTEWLMLDTQGYLKTTLKSSRRDPDLTSEVAITDDTWHRVGFTWDGVSRVLYVDDIEVARDTHGGLQGSEGVLTIGVGSNLDPGTFWSGMIDDVRIYDRAVAP